MNTHVFVFCSPDTGSSSPGECQKRCDYESKGPGTSERQETTGGQLFVFG